MHTELHEDVGKGAIRHETSAAMKAFLLVVVAPTVLASIYYGFLVSEAYVAEARYALRGNTSSSNGSFVDSVLGPSASTTSSGEDALIVRDYILSRDMLDVLDKRLDLRAHYASKDVDFFSRLDEGSSFEEFLEYYQDKVEIELEPGSGISTLKVQAFNALIAQQLAQSIIEISESLVNNITARIVEDSLRFAWSEVAVAEARVRQASDAVTGFRSVSHTIDPNQETSAVLGIITQLESNLANARTELIEAESFMNPTSVQVKNLRARTVALEQQIKHERQRLSAGDGKQRDYTKLIDSYEPLILNKVLAEQIWTSALNSLEAARAEAQRRQRYLITFVESRVPDQATKPDRSMAILSVFVASLLAYAIGGLIWAAIKDHMRM